MPKKTAKPNEKKSASGHTYNIDNVRAGRDVVLGNQSNTIYQTSQTLNVTSPVQFIEELQKLKAEIERLKSLPDVDPAAALGPIADDEPMASPRKVSVRSADAVGLVSVLPGYVAST